MNGSQKRSREEEICEAELKYSSITAIDYSEMLGILGIKFRMSGFDH
jgi:hypothetical protein